MHGAFGIVMEGLFHQMTSFESLQARINIDEALVELSFSDDRETLWSFCLDAESIV